VAVVCVLSFGLCPWVPEKAVVHGRNPVVGKEKKAIRATYDELTGGGFEDASHRDLLAL